MINKFILITAGLLLPLCVLANNVDEKVVIVDYTGAVTRSMDKAKETDRLWPLLVGVPISAAWLPAAAWVSQDNLLAEGKLQRNLLSELKKAITKNENTDLQPLYDWLEAQVPSGRITNALLDPDLLEISPRQNRLLYPRNQFHFPKRPDFLFLLKPAPLIWQKMSYVGGATSEAYLVGIDSDWLWVLEQNGRRSRIGIASWNREVYRPGPGAWLLPEYELGLSESFYPRLLDYLATRVLP